MDEVSGGKSTVVLTWSDAWGMGRIAGEIPGG